MAAEVNTEKAMVNVILTINGKMHLIGMSQDKLDAVSLLVKQAAEVVVPTGKTQAEFNSFLGYKG